MYPMTNRISSQQSYVLSFISNNPGVCTSDVRRYEWSGLGHAATYARVNRLINRGFIRAVRRGARFDLFLTEKGQAAIA